MGRTAYAFSDSRHVEASSFDLNAKPEDQFPIRHSQPVAPGHAFARYRLTAHLA
jgi:hypothetical protein